MSERTERRPQWLGPGVDRVASDADAFGIPLRKPMVIAGEGLRAAEEVLWATRWYADVRVLVTSPTWDVPEPWRSDLTAHAHLVLGTDVEVLGVERQEAGVRIRTTAGEVDAGGLVLAQQVGGPSPFDGPDMWASLPDLPEPIILSGCHVHAGRDGSVDLWRLGEAALTQ